MELSEEVKALEEEWRNLYSKASHLHASLTHIKSEEERKAKAFEIIETFDRIHVIWADLDYYKSSGRLPDKPEEKAPVVLENLSVIELVRRRNTLRSYISKEKKKLNDAEKIQSWKQDIQTINTLLNGK